jgi:hypothetical protein
MVPSVDELSKDTTTRSFRRDVMAPRSFVVVQGWEVQATDISVDGLANAEIVHRQYVEDSEKRLRTVDGPASDSLDTRERCNAFFVRLL